MKPMLAFQKYPDIERLTYPLYASPKLDGVRALVIDGQLVSRTLKPIPNRHVQKLFSGLPEGTDGELIEGAANEDPYRRTVSAVMSEDGEPDITYYVFDNFLVNGGFSVRFAVVSELSEYPHISVVLHVTINSPEELKTFELKCLDMGFEGGMTRKPDGPYKQGRSTLAEEYLLKLKRYEDSDAEITGTYERMHNGNEATVDNLGHTARSSHKANKTGLGDLGGFELRDIHSGVEFRCGTGLDADDRIKLWKRRDKLVGQIIKYKFFPTGAKDKPRHPVFLGFRSKLDL
jgi:DNA ligase 1